VYEGLGERRTSSGYCGRAFDIGLLRSVGFRRCAGICQHQCVDGSVTSMAARRSLRSFVLRILPDVFPKDLREAQHDEFGALLDSGHGGCVGVSIPAGNRKSDCWIKANE
jgi:hypothetical protein